MDWIASYHRSLGLGNVLLPLLAILFRYSPRQRVKLQTTLLNNGHWHPVASNTPIMSSIAIEVDHFAVLNMSNTDA